MNNDALAKRLVTSSYRKSALRIRDAITGVLTIRNSSKPSAPPPSLGEVVGLCGQGGRHPFFRIPQGALIYALERILASPIVPTGGGVFDAALEEICAACEELRQRTVFDVGTGCTNDSLPSLVPLLPPEEIWLDGKELPLDVWRLVSFEFDLVSSAISSHVSVGDFAFSSFSQDALIFRHLVGRLRDRKVSFDIQLAKMPRKWPRYRGVTTFNVSVARIFFEAGCLLTPLANQDFTRWYAAIRYAHWIDEAVTDFKVKDAYNSYTIDSRYRGLFAEEMGIGLMAVVMNSVFGAAPIINTVEHPSASSLRRGKPIADFVAQANDPSDNSPITIIAESKGSLGKHVSPTRRGHAKLQVSSTKLSFPGSKRRLRLTFCSSVFFSAQASPTLCLVTDPPEESRGPISKITSASALKAAYAQAFRFVGMETASRQILRGVPAQSLRPLDFGRRDERQPSELDSRRLRRANSARTKFGMELLLDAGECGVCLDSGVWRILQQKGITEESALALQNELAQNRKRWTDHPDASSFCTSLGLGCTFYKEIDSGDGE